MKASAPAENPSLLAAATIALPQRSPGVNDRWNLAFVVTESRNAISRMHVLAFLLFGPLLWAEDVNPVFGLQSQTLNQLVESDRDVGSLFRKFKRQADAALGDAPHPVRQIRTAGKLASDPDKIESRMAMEDMKKLEAFSFVFTVNGDSRYAGASKRMILAWSQVNEPTGSPIDETKLEPLFVAYGLTRHAFSPAETDSVEAWLRLIANRELDAVRPDSITARNNWNSHRLKTVGLIGYLLNDPALINEALAGFKTQIQQNLMPDGSSLDFHERDALHYHCFDLEPLLTLAIAARLHGVDLYSYRSPSGASLRTSVQFLTPFCDGTATHSEWVHSNVEFDRRRAAAGEAGFKIGEQFKPRDGLRTLELASVFDPPLKLLIASLTGHKIDDHAVWPQVLNSALCPIGADKSPTK